MIKMIATFLFCIAGVRVFADAHRSEEIQFTSQGVELSGTIVFPVDGKVSEEDIYSKYTVDLDGNQVPSYAQALQSRKRKYIWPDFLGKDTDPSEILATLKIPGLWIYGERDGSIPVDLSTQRLKQLIDTGHPFEYVLFSGLGHNNMPETFATVGDWVRRVLK